MRFLSDYPKRYFQDSLSKALAAWHLRGNANVALPELRRPLSWGHLSRRRVSCAHLGQNSSQGFSSAIVSEASFLLSSKGRRGSVLRAVLTSGQRPACRVGVEVPHCLAVETVNGLAASCAFASGANGATSKCFASLERDVSTLECDVKLINQQNVRTTFAKPARGGLFRKLPLRGTEFRHCREVVLAALRKMF
jgi:hypothetical protein